MVLINAELQAAVNVCNLALASDMFLRTAWDIELKQSVAGVLACNVAMVSEYCLVNVAKNNDVSICADACNGIYLF